MKIKILHITKIRAICGSENHLAALLKGLDKQRFEVHYCILAESQHLSVLPEYTTRLEEAGVNVSVVVMHKYVNVRLLWKLRNYMARHQFHIVHTHLIHADLYGTLAAKFAAVPVIISSRHNDDKFRRSRGVIYLNKILAHWHDRVIVISHWIGKFLQEVEGIPPRKIVPIHYGLQPETLAAQADTSYVRREFQIPDQTPVIGTIGRLTEQKGHIYLLRAITQVRKYFPDIRVLLVGDGELRKELEQQTYSLGIATNVIFTGYRTDAARLLSGFDFLVFPSLWEGFGLILLEAMALKKAIVASRVSAIPESVLDGETGLLVPPKDPERLAQAMLTLLRDPDLARNMGENGYTRLQKNFSVQKMIAATEHMYCELLSPPRSQGC